MLCASGWFFFCDHKRMDTQAAQKEIERKEKERAKHRRYYKAHRDELREKAHIRYFKNVHNILEPPPLCTNMRVGQG